MRPFDAGAVFARFWLPKVAVHQGAYVKVDIHYRIQSEYDACDHTLSLQSETNLSPTFWCLNSSDKVKQLSFYAPMSAALRLELDSEQDISPEKFDFRLQSLQISELSPDRYWQIRNIGGLKFIVDHNRQFLGMLNTVNDHQAVYWQYPKGRFVMDWQRDHNNRVNRFSADGMQLVTRNDTVGNGWLNDQPVMPTISSSMKPLNLTTGLSII